MSTGEFEEELTDVQPAATGAVRRASEEDVRRLITGFLPDASVRRVILSFFADLIDVTHAVGASRWAVTIRSGPERVRLVAGAYLVCEISRGTFGLVLERDQIDPDSLPRFQQLTDWERWKFKSYPGAVTCSIPAEAFPEFVPIVRSPSIAFAHAAAVGARLVHHGSLAAHSNGVLEYFETELQRGLPRPIYGPAQVPTTDSLGHVRREDIEAALATFDGERRNTAYWQNWEHDPTYRYVVNRNDRRYPVKEIVRIAAGVHQFNSNQARRLLERLGFTIETLYDTTQRVWLFQANPWFYNLAERIQSASKGAEDDWAVTRYRDEMKAGDHVLLWQASQDAGIYAIGELLSPPEEHTYTPEDVPAWLDAPAGQPVTVWGVVA